MKRLPKWLFLIAGLLFIAAAGIAISVSYLNSRERSIPIVFSNNAMLLETYTAYKENNIDPNSGRTIDKSLDNLTTSEGQSYTMLRSVWMDDKATFDKSWRFAKDNLQRPDSLFSWKYGKLDNGKFGVLTESGGRNTASDGDQDIALALLMAYKRWNNNNYLAEAKPIITSIWEKEVIEIDGKPVLLSNDLERNSQVRVIVNPSYLAPANYKVFDKIDPSHDWKGLADNSYDLINRASAAKLDKARSSGLPPNWIEMDRDSGNIFAPTSDNLDTNFGFDAIRTPFRLALDYAWFEDARAKESLSRFGFLNQFWNDTKLINGIYGHDGSVVGSYESPATYGATIGYFQVMKPETAKEIYETKLQTLYSPDQQSWKAPAPGYYEDNMAWFGIALMQDALPNLTETDN